MKGARRAEHKRIFQKQLAGCRWMCLGNAAVCVKTADLRAVLSP